MYIPFLLIRADEGLAVTKTNTHAFILVVGTVDNIESAVVVCDQRVLTVAVEMVLLSAVLLLLGIHFVYNIEYNPVVREVFEFLHEKLPCIPLASEKKTSVSYCNLYWSLNFIEDKISSESCDDDTNVKKKKNVATTSYSCIAANCD